MSQRIHIVIPDTQVKRDVPLSHLTACSQLITDILRRSPKAIVTIIMLGDWWDMPSLSRHESPASQKMEGADIWQDIQAGNEAMETFLTPIRTHVKKQKIKKPRFVFCIGNHEQRIERFRKDDKRNRGLVSYDNLHLSEWEIVPFEQPIEIDGIRYVHYLKNPKSKHTIGGSIDNRIFKAGWSFSQGHEQDLLFGVKYRGDGTIHQGLVVGAFYQHDEDYKGPQGNHHWRGLVVKHITGKGSYDPEFWSIKRLMETYS